MYCLILFFRKVHEIPDADSSVGIELLPHSTVNLKDGGNNPSFFSSLRNSLIAKIVP